MSRHITVVTPENIEVTYEVAGCASRFMAAVIDILMRVILVLIVGLSASLVAGDGKLAWSGIVQGATFVASFVILFGYPVICEMTWGGRTVGKRLFGLRVIRDGGYPISLVPSMLRNLLLFIDFGVVPLGLGSVLVLWGLPGLVTMFCSPSYKRIGDYAGGTLVIIEAGGSPLGIRRTTAAASDAAGRFTPAVRNIDRLTVDEYRVIRRFTSRRADMDLIVQAAIGERLARPIMERLDIRAPIHYQTQFADLLEAIERRYAEERGVL
jgi:uncharacterized RDD family membrane protein YckC